MKFGHIFVSALSLVAMTCTAAEPSAPVERLVSSARSSCEALEEGNFEVDPDFLVALDLDGDTQEDQLVDESRFACSSSASLFAASGGSMLHAIVKGVVFSWQVNAWRIVNWGEDKILLLAEHGSECGGYGYQPCYEAVVFSEGRPISLRPLEPENLSQ